MAGTALAGRGQPPTRPERPDKAPKKAKKALEMAKAADKEQGPQGEKDDPDGSTPGLDPGATDGFSVMAVC